MPQLQSGVVYVGHLPHGFYEKQLMGYFSQFGTVNKVRVARNKKSGHCKGFAFIEFECDEVAKIVAKTMNNYLMFNKLVKCQFVDQSRIILGRQKKHSLQKEVSRAIRLSRAQKRQNKCQTINEHRQRVKRLLRREKRKRSSLAKMEMNYDFPGYEASLKKSKYKKKPSHVLFVPHNEHYE